MVELKASVMAVVQGHFRPEFINRLDDIVVFHPLDKAQIKQIAGIQLHGLEKRLAERGIETHVLPATTSWAQVEALHPDGVLLSNGPGDPAAVTGVIRELKELLAIVEVPVFGVCLGHQLLALALGGRTYKMKFGHHGGNHPVRHEDSRRVAITSQNHGFAVDIASLGAGAALTHLNLFDGTAAGLRLRDRPISSVQYHPEASPGPHDASDLLSNFVAQVRRHRGAAAAAAGGSAGRR